MTKELDTFSYAFMVELVDCPKRNAFPLRKGKPEMFRFNGGYYSFDEEGKMDGCHLYVQDYQGNNRMVVNAYTDEVEQINHYYPYGALMGDISTQPEKQNFKYSGKELDRTYGLDLHDFEARQQDPIIGGRFTSVDPMAEKYYWLSPYAYCAGDPINLVDPTGKDVCILIEPSGAGGCGHMAILIQSPEDGKWYLYSKNGVGEGASSGASGPADHDQLQVGADGRHNSEMGFGSPEEFFASKLNLDKDGNVIYTEGYQITTDKTQDKDAEEGARDYIGAVDENGNTDFKDYNLVSRNCAQTVQNALSRAGLNPGLPSLTERIIRGVTGGHTLADEVVDRMPNTIYRRIKEQNPGKVIPYKKK